MIPTADEEKMVAIIAMQLASRQRQILEYAAANGGVYCKSEMSRSLNIPQSSLVRASARLEEFGLVKLSHIEMTRNEQIKKFYVLTPLGERIAAACKEVRP